MSLQKGNRDHSTAGGFDDFSPDDPVHCVIPSFDQDVGLEHLDQRERRVFLEYDNKVDGVDGREFRDPGVEIVDRSTGPLDSADGGVAVQANDEDLPQFCGFIEGVDVTRVKEVETAVREDQGPAGGSQPFSLEQEISAVDSFFVRPAASVRGHLLSTGYPVCSDRW